MIKRLRVKNFRSLASIDVTFEPLTVFVGQNGSGKSNIIDVLRFTHDAMRHGLDSAIVNRHGMGALRRWSDKGRPYDVEINLEFTTKEVSGSYGFTLGSERRGEYRVKREECAINLHDGNDRFAHYHSNNGEWVAKPSDIAPAIEDNTFVLPLIAQSEPFRHLYTFLTGMSFYNIFPDTLTEPQKPANPYPLDEYGSNLASALRELQRVQSRLLPKLEESIQTVMPDILNFQVNQVGGYLVTKLRHKMSDTSRAMFELSQESDGTLRMLGILTALFQDPPRTLVVLEEPELTIHPGALRLLWDEIENAAERSQIILTTHSPDLLDLCQVDSLRIVEKIEGITEVGPIEDAQKAAIQERLFAPGEMLRSHGLRRMIQGELATEYADEK